MTDSTRVCRSRTCAPQFAIVRLHMADRCDGLPGEYLYVDRVVHVDRDGNATQAREYRPQEWGLACVEPPLRWNGFGGLDVVGTALRYCVSPDLDVVRSNLKERVSRLPGCRICEATWTPYGDGHGYALLHRLPTCPSTLPGPLPIGPVASQERRAS